MCSTASLIRINDISETAKSKASNETSNDVLYYIHVPKSWTHSNLSDAHLITYSPIFRPFHNLHSFTSKLISIKIYSMRSMMGICNTESVKLSFNFIQWLRRNNQLKNGERGYGGKKLKNGLLSFLKLTSWNSRGRRDGRTINYNIFRGYHLITRQFAWWDIQGNILPLV